MSRSALEKLRKRMALVAYFRDAFGVDNPNDPESVRQYYEEKDCIRFPKFVDADSTCYLLDGDGQREGTARAHQLPPVMGRRTGDSECSIRRVERERASLSGR